MAIRNFNLVQENNINQNYILESLANLGQRFSIQGDSIKPTYKTIREVFSSVLPISNEDYKNYIYRIENTQEEDTYRIILFEVDNVNGLIKNSEDAIKSTYKNWYVESLTDTVSGNVYSNVSSINTSDSFSFIVYDDTAKEVIIESYKKHSQNNLFSLSSKELIYSVRITDNKLNFLVRNNSTDGIKYDLTIYTGNVSYQSIRTRQAVLIDILTSLSQKDTDIESYIRNLGFSSSISGGEYELNSSLNSYTGNDTDYTTKLNYSSKHVYSTVFKGYSNETFNIDDESLQNSLYLELLFELFDTIGEDVLYIPADYELNVAINDNSEWKVYYSTKDIKLRYINESASNLWFSQNYYLEDGEESNQYHDSVLCFNSDIEKILFYQFLIDYDSYLEGVNDIIVSHSSSLPYIDSEGYWVINGIQTIKAKGEDAGNPNIILVESYLNGTEYKTKTNKTIESTDDFEITKAEYKAELLSNKVTWEAKEFKIQPIEKVDLNDTSFTSEFDYLQVYAAIPTLPEDEEIANMLRNAIVINISGLDCINYNGVNYTEEQVKNIYGNDGVITSIWVINDDGTEFDYIRQRNNPVSAADFNYLANTNNLIQYALASFTPREPDTYLFSHLAFDAISFDLKNNTSESRSYVYPNIINKLGSQYNTNNLGNYSNDMNFILRFNDTAVIDANNKLLSISQNSTRRYINTNPVSSGASNLVTNSLYSYFDINGKSAKYNEYIPNYNVPSLDLGEVLTRNETLLNRLNILSLDNIGTSYLSYIGTSINTEKNILTIGTSNTNINLGTETLAFESDKKNFVTQNIVNVDFPTINLNGNTNIDRDLEVNGNLYTNGVSWEKYQSDSKTSYSSVFVPTGKYIYEPGDIYNGSGSTGIIRLNVDASETNIEQLTTYSFYNYAVTKGKLYTISTIKEKYYVHVEGVSSPTRMHNIYISDGLYLPKLLADLGFEKYIAVDSGSNKVYLRNVELNTNMYTITFNSNPIILLTTATVLYDRGLYFYDRIHADGTNADAFIENLYNFTGDIFTGNPLKVTYRISDSNKLYLDIYELPTEDKIHYVRKIECNYTKY